MSTVIDTFVIAVPHRSLWL